LFGDYNWDFHYTHGQTRTNLNESNNVNAARLYAAIDAVTDPTTGNIACRVSVTAPGAFPGCVPFNFANPSSAAVKYVEGTTAWTADNGLDDFGANITGTAFDDWAGPVKVAMGAEYRLASLNVSTTVPNNTFNPEYLRLGPNGNSLPSSYPSGDLAWVKEVQSGAQGSEDVAEGDVELDVPLLKDLPLIELLSFNGAYRYTAYSTAGDGSTSKFSSNTWKLGLEWQVFDDLKFRATRSRDMRAPTLWDLYQQQTESAGGYNDPLTSVNGTLNTVSGGNPDLKPEVSRNTTAGVVYTPSWFSGFSTSIDYFHFVIDNAIGAVAGDNPAVQSICLASPGGSSPYCNLLARPISYNSTSPANYPTLQYSLNENIVFIDVEGVNLEMGYQTDLSEIGWNGDFSFRALWTHMPTYKSQSLPGTLITNQAGTAQTPSDKGAFTIDYRLNNFSVDLLEHYSSPFHFNANPTLVYTTGDVRAYYTTDITFNYDFLAGELPATGFISIQNMFNAQGGLYQPPGTTPGQEYPVAPNVDVIGRYFTVGVRFKM
jgi:outer membrane receptor protein involved in Fe transport